jgi:hypothetical protein
MKKMSKINRVFHAVAFGSFMTATAVFAAQAEGSSVDALAALCSGLSGVESLSHIATPQDLEAAALAIDINIHTALAPSSPPDLSTILNAPYSNVEGPDQSITHALPKILTPKI